MGIFSKIFGKSGSQNNSKKKPPIHGGNGTCKEDPAIINCTSLSTANMLMNRFISEKHGELDVDWKRTIEFFLDSKSDSGIEIRVIDVKCSDGTQYQYYFDVTRAMNVLNKMMGID